MNEDEINECIEAGADPDVVEQMIDGMTADEHRAEARENYERREESSERCDTDGFLSQWASGINGQLHQAKADIAEAGGRWSFRVLAEIPTKDGADYVVVPSKSIQTRYGYRRVTLDCQGRFDEFMGLSDRAVGKHGYEWISVAHPANAVIHGSGRGLSGNAWVANVPVCEECDREIEAIGLKCRCGHLTEFEVEGTSPDADL
jgi:hypothetical protein